MESSQQRLSYTSYGLSIKSCCARNAIAISPSDKVHVLGTGFIETTPPCRKVKSPTATQVGVSQTLVEVEVGTRANNLNSLSALDISVNTCDLRPHLRGVTKLSSNLGYSNQDSQ
jgi:hypothetical protein